MAIKPILFNTEMIQTILGGRKACTRRLVKLPSYIKQQENGLYTLWAEGTCYENQYLEEIIEYIKAPYQPGDILYVRETWKHFECWNCEGDEKGNCPKEPQKSVFDKTCGCYMYRATNEISGDAKWHPSIHMPKEAARIWLKVTDVRMERLQECGEGWCIDIEKEGITTPQDPILYISDDAFHNALRMEFQKTWDSTIKKSDLDRYGWNANPWVWVIEFERCDKPESEG